MRCAAALVLVSMLSARALAHGGPPTLESVVVDPTNPNRLLAATNFGVLASRDGGVSWGWICPRALGLRIDVEDPLVEIAANGSHLVGDTAGLWRAATDACDWLQPEPALTNIRVGAIARAGTMLLAGTSDEGMAGSILRSSTHGASFTVVLGPNDGAWYESILAAPSAPLRIYAVQNRPPPDIAPWEITMLLSDTGGDVFAPTLFDHVEHEWRVYVLAIDPTDPDRALARTQNLYPGEHERLMLTEDGGANWREVLTMVQILGASFSSDGRTAWCGGPVDGLWRSDDGGVTFESVYAAQVRCTLVRDDAIWICADDFGDGFALGRSTDGGASFEPVARLRSITGILECPTASTVHQLCPAEQAVLDTILASAPFDDAGSPDLDAGVDSGVALDGGVLDAGLIVPSGGCGCRSVGTRHPRALWIFFFVLLAFARRSVWGGPPPRPHGSSRHLTPLRSARCSRRILR